MNEQQQEIPIGTPVLAYTCDEPWRFGYYGGKSPIYDDCICISARPNEKARWHYRLAVPFSDFDFNNPDINIEKAKKYEQ